MHATIAVRPGSSGRARSAALRKLALQLPPERAYPDYDEWLREHAASPADLARVESFARRHGLEFETSASRCSVTVIGAISAISRAFRVELIECECQRCRYHSHRGPIWIPLELRGIVQAVIGLDSRPLARPCFIGRRQAHQRPTKPAQIERLYDFPEAVRKHNQCVGIIVLGGGLRMADLRAYAQEHGLRLPRITLVSAGGFRNRPSSAIEIRKFWKELETSGKVDPSSKPALTIETTMDVELVTAFANAAHIVIYLAPANLHGIRLAFTTALTDTANNPSVLSCSFGLFEDECPRSFARAMNQVFQLAALKGVTICCSSGDNGDGSPPERAPQAFFPASSPFVLACGGTHLHASASAISETVWKERIGANVLASGGGASRFFPLPAWQRTAGVKKKTGKASRGVPDIAGKADLRTGYLIHAGGIHFPMGGTSAAVPVWASLIARINQALGTATGYLNPLLYTPPFRNATRDITRGSSGKRFRASRGWDPCTGWGSPKGKALLAALTGPSS